MEQLFNLKNKVVVKEVPRPQCGDQEILVKTVYSIMDLETENNLFDKKKTSLIEKALSRKDLVNFAIKKAKNVGVIKTYKYAKSMFSDWSSLGYGSVGTIIQVGKGVKGYNVGDSVACAGFGKASHAEYITISSTMANVIPTGVELKQAVLAATGSIAINLIHCGGVNSNHRVVVYGLGLVGQIISKILFTIGCQVIEIDKNKKRTEQAQLHQAIKENFPNDVLDFTNGFGADVVIITPGYFTTDVLASAREICKKKGKVVVFGNNTEIIDSQQFKDKEIIFLVSTIGVGVHSNCNFVFHNSNNYSCRNQEHTTLSVKEAMGRFLGLLKEGKISVQNLMGLELPLSKASEEYKKQLKGGPFNPVLLNYALNIYQREPPLIITSKIKPKDSYGVAIVGGGSFAREIHIPALIRHKKLFLKTILTKNGHTATKVASQYGISQVTSSFDSILEDPEIEVVVITTPHSTHSYYAVKAIEAGKNVFLEKPLALTPEQCFEVADALKKNPVKFTLGFNRTFSPLSHELKTRLRNRKNPLVINYRMQGVVNKTKEWIYDPNVGGGRIIGELCHIFDYILWLTQSKVISLDAISTSYTGDGYMTDNHNVIIVKCADGSVASINYSEDGNINVTKERIEVIGCGNVIVIDDFSSININGKKRKVKQQKGFEEHYQEFLNSLDGKESNIINIDRALDVMDLCFKTLNILKQKTGERK